VHGPRWYRVEHHSGEQIRTLGRIADVAAHHSTLTPFLSRLLLAGVRDGELVLIEEATGRPVARRPVRPPRRRTARYRRSTMPARPATQEEAASDFSYEAASAHTEED
jgi:hypothetical protein